MNNIEKRLRQLNTIEADPAYVRDSRARLMMMARPQLPRVTLRAFMAGMLRSGSAMAAIGLLLFFAIGGSIWNLVIDPVAKLAKWDDKTLRAEAQAIDTQIHMVDLQYNDPGYERQRLISPNTDFSSITIAPIPEDEDLPATTPAEDPTIASSTDSTADDGTNASSTDPTADDGTNASSTPAEPEDTTVDVEEALDILSH